jgi:16S rRNA processing protein RimM
MEHPIIVGKFGSVYGVHGWLRVYSHTDPIDNIARYADWHIRRGKAWLRVEPVDAKYHGKSLIVKLAGCDDRELAKTYTNFDIYVERAELSDELEDGEYYWADLVGCEVKTPNGDRLGIVDHLFDTGSNDVIVVKDQARQKRHLIPDVKSIVHKIDLEKQVIIADWDPEF